MNSCGPKKPVPKKVYLRGSGRVVLICHLIDPADFQASECYMPRVKLEAGSDGTFLETNFAVEDDYIHFRLKNVNEGCDRKVWRYQPFDSYSTREQKVATLIATLKKVEFRQS